MGGGRSKPAPAPQKLIVEDPEPTSSTLVQLAGSDAPINMPVDGVSIAIAEGCDQCALTVVPNISTATVKLTRDFGDISYSECKRFLDERKLVNDQKLSFSDYKARLMAGTYYRVLPNKTYCEQLTLSADDAKGADSMVMLDIKFKTGRIRKISGGGFSQDTKIQITPSIPLKMTVSIRNDPAREIIVSQMTLYHPSPMRIENVQHDAVLSLNDPATTGPGGVIVLIPLVSGNLSTPSSEFMSRILGNLSQLLEPDPVTGLYQKIDAPTGADWTLNTLLPTDPETNAVKSGIFVWEGTPELERYVSEDTATIQRTSWRRKRQSAPLYVMLEKPLTMNSSDFTALLQFPVTRPEQAIHEMLQGSLTYKCGPSGGTAPTGTGSTVTETFQTRCDPFMPNYTKNYGYRPEQMIGTLFNVLIFVAMALGVWAALILVGDYRTDQIFQNLSSTLGKLIVRLMKGAQKASQGVGGLMPQGGIASLVAAASGQGARV
jgi:hypothetical protein